MKLGMPQLYEFDNIEDNLKLAKELNLDFIELNLNFGYCRKQMEEENVASLLKKYNLEATLHFYDEADLGSYPEVVDAYLKLLDRYASLGKGYIKMINFHLIPGPVVTISGVKNYIYEKEYDSYIKGLIANFKKAEDICKKNDIIMVIENTDIVSKYMKQTYKDLNLSGFKFNYDIGHDNVNNDFLWQIQNDYDIKFTEFHIHDGNRKTCHLALGQGCIDILKFKKLAQIYDAYVVLEVKSSEDLKISVPVFNRL